MRDEIKCPHCKEWVYEVFPDLRYEGVTEEDVCRACVQMYHDIEKTIRDWYEEAIRETAAEQWDDERAA